MKKLTVGQAEYIARDCLDGGGTFDDGDVVDFLDGSYSELNLSESEKRQVIDALYDLRLKNQDKMARLKEKHFPNGFVRISTSKSE